MKKLLLLTLAFILNGQLYAGIVSLENATSSDVVLVRLNELMKEKQTVLRPGDKTDNIDCNNIWNWSGGTNIAKCSVWKDAKTMVIIDASMNGNIKIKEINGQLVAE